MKILMIPPNNRIDSPAYQRFKSYINYFERNNYKVVILASEANDLNTYSIIRRIYRIQPDLIFISQPPFNLWMLYVIPFIKIILDIRDGWSISIKSGYGGLVKPNLVKYNIVSQIEKIMLRNSVIVITCTLGLQKYLEKKYKRDVVFLPNGLSKKNYDKINKTPEPNTKSETDNLIFSCAGQFSEYGKVSAKKVIDTIHNRYISKNCTIQVIGADEQRNSWITNYIRKYPNLKYQYIPRVNHEQLYTLLKKSDYAITIVRDPRYEYGTKIFEYIACELKVINYYSEANNFTSYFNGYFDINLSHLKTNNVKIIREDNFECLDTALARYYASSS